MSSFLALKNKIGPKCVCILAAWASPSMSVKIGPQLPYGSALASVDSHASLLSCLEELSPQLGLKIRESCPVFELRLSWPHENKSRFPGALPTVQIVPWPSSEEADLRLQGCKKSSSFLSLPFPFPFFSFPLIFSAPPQGR